MTLLEVTVVTAIVAVVSGMVFAGGQDARERARQQSCASRLGAIRTALSLYDSDHEPYTVDAGGHPFPVIPSSLVLLPYLKSSEALHCPERTALMRRKFLTTYEFRNLIQPWRKAPDPGTRAVLQQIRARGGSAPLVICHIHDELYYQPRERTVAPAYARPFVLELRADGSVFRGRMPYLRNKMWSH